MLLHRHMALGTLHGASSLSQGIQPYQVPTHYPGAFLYGKLWTFIPTQIRPHLSVVELNTFIITSCAHKFPSLSPLL